MPTILDIVVCLLHLKASAKEEPWFGAAKLVF